MKFEYLWKPRTVQLIIILSVFDIRLRGYEIKERKTIKAFFWLFPKAVEWKKEIINFKWYFYIFSELGPKNTLSHTGAAIFFYFFQHIYGSIFHFAAIWASECSLFIIGTPVHFSSKVWNFLTKFPIYTTEINLELITDPGTIFKSI